MYVDDENAAKNAHRGIWDGTFQTPSEWRKEQKANRSSSANTSSPESPTGTFWQILFDDTDDLPAHD